MGWGQEPYEGWADKKLPDGAGSGRHAVAAILIPLRLRRCAAVGGVLSASIGSRPARPISRATTVACRMAPECDAWIAAREAADNACWEDWNAEHCQALLGHEPHTQLILGRSDGGPRHYLDGKPVHAGDTLELLTDSEDWLPVRYEWDWNVEHAPRAYFNLGLPAPARGVTEPPDVSVALPSTAILRWRSRDQLKGRP
jgi:hypothetical protein